jgi:hypothetical protein
MKFSTIVKGKKAERLTTYRLFGQDVQVIVQPLSALEEIDVASTAMAFAKSKDAEPKAGDPVYEAAFMARALILACMDPESSPAAREPHFDGGTIEQVLSLDPDSLAMLFEQQRLWQEECSPSIRTMSPAELFAAVKRVAEDDGPLASAFYGRLSHHTRLTLLRFTGAQLLKLQELKPWCSSPSWQKLGTSASAAPTTPQ